jgi:hypothetical protein
VKSCPSSTGSVVGRQRPTETGGSEPLQRQPDGRGRHADPAAISSPNTPEAFNRSTSRTWTSQSSLLASSPPVAKAKGADAKRSAETPSNRATSSRSGGRNHLNAAATGDHRRTELPAQPSSM